MVKSQFCNSNLLLLFFNLPFISPTLILALELFFSKPSVLILKLMSTAGGELSLEVISALKQVLLKGLCNFL